jgi:hypothetical protein
MRADGVSSCCYIMYTTIRLERRHTSKAWPGTLVDPSLLSGETNMRSPSWSDQLGLGSPLPSPSCTVYSFICREGPLLSSYLLCVAAVTPTRKSAGKQLRNYNSVEEEIKVCAKCTG